MHLLCLCDNSRGDKANKNLACGNQMKSVVSFSGSKVWKRRVKRMCRDHNSKTGPAFLCMKLGCCSSSEEPRESKKGFFRDELLSAFC